MDKALFEQDDGVSYCLCLTFSFMPRQTAGCNYTLVLMEAADHTEACILLFFWAIYFHSDTTYRPVPRQVPFTGLLLLLHCSPEFTGVP